MAPAAAILLNISAVFWIAAFVGYAVLFGGMLARPRRQARSKSGA
jgi:uncharacterized protein involved in response to NO